MNNSLISSNRKHGIDKIVSISIPAVCFCVLFLIWCLKKTYLFNSPYFLRIFNLMEWPLYLLCFASGLLRAHFRVRELVEIILVGAAFMMTFLVTGNAELLKAVLLAVAMCQESYNKTIKFTYMMYVFSVLLTIALYLLGLSDAGTQRRGATSLGYTQANAIGFVCMMLAIYTFQKSPFSTWTAKSCLLAVIIAGFVLSDSRTGCLLAVLVILLSNRKVYSWIHRHKTVQLLLALLPCFCFVFSIGTAMTYTTNPLNQVLNTLLNSRIWMNYYMLNKYGFSMFGQNISRGTDLIENPVTHQWSSYMTIDCAYIDLLIQMGVVTAVLVCVLYFFLVKKLVKEQAYAIIIATSAILLYGITESSIVSIYAFLPFLLLINKQPFVLGEEEYQLIPSGMESALVYQTAGGAAALPAPPAKRRKGFRFVWKPPIWLDEDDGRATGVREENVSFAVFDTLIRRSVARPADLFRIMERNHPNVPEHFAEKRVEAEQAARAKLGTRMGLADIYEELLPLYGNHTNDLMALEIQYEIAGCRPVADNIDLVNLCMEHDKNVFLIADTYLPSSVLRRMLDVCGVYHYDRLYVSCEEGACKADGSLFWKVLADQEIRPSELRHIGSDRQGDVTEPWRVGVHVKRGKKKDTSSVDKDLPEDIAVYERTLQACIRNCADDLDSDDARLGCETFGPLLTGFTAWLREQLRRDGIQDVYFLAGDGAVLKQAFDALEDGAFRTHSVYFPAQAADQDHEALLAYIRACGMQGRVALVNSWWQVGVQKTLESLIAEARLNIQVKGYYVGLNPDMDSIQAAGYLYGQGQGKETLEKLSPITVLFDTIFHAQHGPVRRIAMRDGQPVPELDDSEYASDEGRICDEIAILRAYQAGALTLVREMNTAFPGGMPQLPDEAAILPLLRMGTKPTRQEAELWGNFRVFKDGKAMPMAQPKGMGAYLLHPGQLKRDYAASPWKIGFLRRLIRLPLAYDKIAKNG